MTNLTRRNTLSQLIYTFVNTTYVDSRTKFWSAKNKIMAQKSTLTFAVILAITLLSSLKADLGLLGYILESSLIGLITAYLMTGTKRSIFKYNQRVFVCIVALITIFLIHNTIQVWNGFSLDLTFRVISFPVTALLFIIVFPNLFSRHSFLIALALVSLPLVLIGLPTVLFGSISLIGVTISPHHSTTNLAFGGISINYPLLTSILGNPNITAKWAFYGFISGIYMFMTQQKSRRLFGVITVGVMIAGLFLTYSRSAILATTIALTVFIPAYLDNKNILIAITTTSIVFIFTLVSIIIGVIPGPQTISSIRLSGRYELWATTVNVAKSSPIIGLGPDDASALIQPYLGPRLAGLSPHNSYLRILLTTGIVGLSSYLYIHFEALRVNLLNSTSPASASIYALLVGTIILQIFEGFSIFGLGSTSIISSIIIGYSSIAVADRSVQIG